MIALLWLADFPRQPPWQIHVMKPSKEFLGALILIGVVFGWLAVRPVWVAPEHSPVPVQMPRSNVDAGGAALPTVTTVTTVTTATGIMTDPQFKVALHALRQRSGVETLAEPEVVTKSDWLVVNRMYYGAIFTFCLTNR